MTIEWNNFFLVYIARQFFWRMVQFFSRWYRDGFLSFWRKLRDILSTLDYTFAVRITFKHWREPLYQDRTIIGYILGFIFRTTRIVIGSIIYAFIFFIWTILLLIWFLIPVGLLFGAIVGF